MNQGVESASAFNEFRDYYTEHLSALSNELVRNIKTTADAIAVVFKGQNRMESAILKELDALMD